MLYTVPSQGVVVVAGQRHCCRVEVPADEGVEARGGTATSWYTRVMPMSFMVAMENLIDPSHLSFAHHGTNPGAPHAIVCPPS